LAYKRRPKTIRRRRTATAWWFSICLLTSHSACPQDTTKVDALFADWDKSNTPGCAVVIVKDGTTVYENGYGLANLESPTKITPQTVFDVASVSKQFTGLAIAMLIEQRKLALDTDIRAILPELPDFGRPIEIQNLLHHTSGLRDWSETLALSGVGPGAPISLDMIIDMVRHQRELDFPPGQEFQYSNTGYSLLAAAVTKVTGQTFPAWMSEHLFKPLGMEHTFVASDPTSIILNRADSYRPDTEGQYVRVPSQTAAQGSSSLFTTVDDMGKWLRNFDSARVGGMNDIQMTWTPGALQSGENVAYGFGWGLGSYRGIPAVEHTGRWAGYVSDVVVVPTKRFATAILCNAADVPNHDIVLKITGIYLPGMPNPRSSSTPPAVKTHYKGNPKTWGHFLGTYRLGTGWLLTISRDGQHLMAQASNEDKFEMTPVGKSTFFVSAYKAPVEFQSDAEGKVSSLLYRGITAPRIEPQDMTTSELEKFVGDYWSEELRHAGRIELRDGRLAVENPLHDWVYLQSIGRNRFDADDRRLSIEFVEKSDGSISEAKVSLTRVRNVRFVRVTLPRDP
jgi:CubicO group peptidase (beta-lactamase class C family)